MYSKKKMRFHAMLNELTVNYSAAFQLIFGWSFVVGHRAKDKTLKYFCNKFALSIYNKSHVIVHATYTRVEEQIQERLSNSIQ